LKKGAPVYIEGSLQTSSYTDKTTGVKKYSTQIVIRDLQDLGGKRQDSPAQQQPQEKEQPSTFEDFDDDIPF
jgi:single-strand DNA-binding protein